MTVIAPGARIEREGRAYRDELAEEHESQRENMVCSLEEQRRTSFAGRFEWHGDRDSAANGVVNSSQNRDTRVKTPEKDSRAKTPESKDYYFGDPSSNYTSPGNRDRDSRYTGPSSRDSRHSGPDSKYKTPESHDKRSGATGSIYNNANRDSRPTNRDSALNNRDSRPTYRDSRSDGPSTSKYSVLDTNDRTPQKRHRESQSVDRQLTHTNGNQYQDNHEARRTNGLYNRHGQHQDQTSIPSQQKNSAPPRKILDCPQKSTNPFSLGQVNKCIQ